MTEQKTAYVVTSGEYSDYGVDAVFATLGLAEAWLRGEGLTENEHGEWRKTPGGYDSWRVEEFRYFDGDVLPLDAKL